MFSQDGCGEEKALQEGYLGDCYEQVVATGHRCKVGIGGIGRRQHITWSKQRDQRFSG